MEPAEEEGEIDFNTLSQLLVLPAHLGWARLNFELGGRFHCSSGALFFAELNKTGREGQSSCRLWQVASGKVRCLGWALFPRTNQTEAGRSWIEVLKG